MEYWRGDAVVAVRSAAGVPLLLSVQGEGRGRDGSSTKGGVTVTERQFGPVPEHEFTPDGFSKELSCSSPPPRPLRLRLPRASTGTCCRSCWDRLARGRRGLVRVVARLVACGVLGAGAVNARLTPA